MVRIIIMILTLTVVAFFAVGAEGRSVPWIIPENYFSGKRDVRHLNLSRQHIIGIHPKAFCGLNSLITLDLSDNLLKYLDPETFVCVPKLKVLYLKNNVQLKMIRIKSDSIEKIDISFCCTNIQYDGRMFSQMKRLKVIVGKGNPICPLIHLYNTDVVCSATSQKGGWILSEEYFANHKVQNIRILDLSKKNITYIHPETFCRFHNLISLDLSFNNLHYLDPMTFNCIPKLIKLFLRSNPKLGLNFSGVLFQSTSLREIHIQDCNFSSYADDMFSGLKNIAFINAGGNAICSEIRPKEEWTVSCGDGRIEHTVTTNQAVKTEMNDPVSTSQSVTTDTPVPVSTIQGVTTDAPVPVSTSQGVTTDTPVPVSTSQGVTTDTPVPVSTSQDVTTDTPVPVSTSQSVMTDTPVPVSTSQGVTTDTPVPVSTDHTLNTYMDAPVSTDDTMYPFSSSTVLDIITTNKPMEEDHYIKNILIPLWLEIMIGVLGCVFLALSIILIWMYCCTRKLYSSPEDVMQLSEKPRII